LAVFIAGLIKREMTNCWFFDSKLA